MRRLLDAATVVCAGAALAGAAADTHSSTPPAAPPTPAIVESGITPTERRDVFARTLREATLDRVQMIRALSSLQPQVAAAVVGPIHHDYAEVIGAVQSKADTTLFELLPGAPTDAERKEQESRQRHGRGTDADIEYVKLVPIDSAGLVRLADEITEAFVRATAIAARELAEAGSVPGRTAEMIEADLLRLLVARQFQYMFKGYHDDESPGYDLLVDFDEACRTDPRIGAAAVAARKAPANTASLETAVAEFRRRGAELGRSIVARSGAGAAVSRTRWLGQPEPPQLTRTLEPTRDDLDAWIGTTETCADALEAFLRGGDDPLAAARWRMRVLNATASPSIVTRSWGSNLRDTAQLFGASTEEIAAMQQVLDDATVPRVALAKATLAAYRRWNSELKREGKWAGASDPPEALLRAHERQMSFERSLRDRVLALVQSSLLRDELASIADPADSYRSPFWLQAWKQRAAGANEHSSQETVP